MPRMKFWLRATTSALALVLATQADAAIVFSSNAPGQTDLGFVAGTYEIIVSGAQGGDTVTDYGGRGATVWGTFHLASPGTFRIIVGGQGGYGHSYLYGAGGGGGGGGSFVFLTGGNNPLAIAGGGGGVYGMSGGPGQAGSGTGLSGRGGAAGGGTGSYGGDGGGGGGFSQNGANGGAPLYGSGATGGGSAIGGGQGGGGGGALYFGADGGFGGGGGGGGGGAGVYYYYSTPGYSVPDGYGGYDYVPGNTYYGTTYYYGAGGGGGGGGFRGGRGGTPGYAGQGGYSYLGSNVLPGTYGRYSGDQYIQRFLSYRGLGNGYVSINLISADQTGIPEPASMGLFGLSLAGLALARRRGRK